jgi:hypothetical protein
MARRAESLLCRWDLDKTYLRSEFETLRQLLRTAWERGEDKIEVPGVPEVLKALKASSERARRPLAIHFISASPPQIGKAIRDKLALDGVPYDGIVFKDQLRHIRRGKFRNLREHVACSPSTTSTAEVIVRWTRERCVATARGTACSRFGTRKASVSGSGTWMASTRRF